MENHTIFMYWRTQLGKKSVLHKLAYRFNAIAIKTTREFWIDVYKFILNCMWKIIGLNVILWVELHSPRCIFWHLNPHCLIMWPYLEIGSLERLSVKVKLLLWSLIQYNWCPQIRGNLETDTCIGRMPCEDEDSHHKI